ncbi:MAG: hypothetical protein V3V08_24210 [Nannocystaceae bacterium]
MRSTTPTDSPPPGETAVFYVTSHGSAGDHWFDWLARAFNANPDLMVYMGETVRAKYLRERSRKERPNLIAFTEFLADMGRPYPAVGEFFAYRAYQLEELRSRYGNRVRFVNVVRHPYCWLRAYVTWRCTNMGMRSTDTMAVDHEWSVVCHDTYRRLGLKTYTRGDIETWATLQGLHILNRMRSDARDGVCNVALERLVSDPVLFNETAAHLSHGRVQFEARLLDHVYAWTQTPFRANWRILDSPGAERQRWPQWQEEAYDALVGEQARSMFASFGYTLDRRDAA